MILGFIGTGKISSSIIFGIFKSKLKIKRISLETGAGKFFDPARKLFKKCRSLADSLNLPDCSMGMSEDWEEAICAGSTWVRLGSLIFGDRSY